MSLPNKILFSLFRRRVLGATVLDKKAQLKMKMKSKCFKIHSPTIYNKVKIIKIAGATGVFREKRLFPKVKIKIWRAFCSLALAPFSKISTPNSLNKIFLNLNEESPQAVYLRKIKYLYHKIRLSLITVFFQLTSALIRLIFSSRQPKATYNLLSKTIDLRLLNRSISLHSQLAIWYN